MQLKINNLDDLSIAITNDAFTDEQVHTIVEKTCGVFFIAMPDRQELATELLAFLEKYPKPAERPIFLRDLCAIPDYDLNERIDEL